MISDYKVLIVDDIPYNVEILETTLEDKYILATASSGEEALEIIPQFRPDLVLLDIMMPGIDGYEVCRRLKANDQFNFIKIILVTGKALVEERLKGYEVGADDYVTKPFVLKELEAKIKVFLNLKRSNEIDRLKTDLLVLFAHETRTPLNGIIGGSDLLMRDDTLDENVKSTVKLICDSGQRLLDFIDKTMYLCELKSMPPLTFSKQSISKRIGDLITLLENEASKKNIEIKLEIKNETEFEADWSMLEKAISHVLENAIKYSNQNTSIQVLQRLSNNVLVLEIIDQGEGIPAEWIDKIFDEFAVKDIIHHQKGQGLSLSITKHIMELHGGKIKVKSELKKGASFTLTLPVRK